LENNHASFPNATLFINLMGSFILGWFVVYSAKKSTDKNMILGIQTGLIGSFTTFSTFNAELILLMKEGHYAVSALYFSCSAFLGIAAIFFGMKCGAITLEKAGTKK
jgi:fluoride exporter